MGNYECNKCGALYSSMDDLANHMKQAHNQNSSGYTCADCGEFFNTKTDLEIHIRQAHPQ